jgi:hypothetical protein
MIHLQIYINEKDNPLIKTDRDLLTVAQGRKKSRKKRSRKRSRKGSRK